MPQTACPFRPVVQLMYPWPELAIGTVPKSVLLAAINALRRANSLTVTDLSAGAAGNATTQIHIAPQRRGGMCTPRPSRVGKPDASDRRAEWISRRRCGGGVPACCFPTKAHQPGLD